jgi:hypothetical protein
MGQRHLALQSYDIIALLLHFSTIRKLRYRPAHIERERKADTWPRIQTF